LQSHVIRNAAWAICFALLNFACGATPQTAPVTFQRAIDDRLDAILWQVTSVEYRILAQSIYASAATHLDRALADPQWTALPTQKENYQMLPPAVIVDIDETVIDTTKFQSQLVRNQARFSSRPWAEWQARNEPQAVPGAVEFITYAESRGVTIFYVTNRDYSTEPSTRLNLKTIGLKLPVHVDTVLSRNERPDWPSDKESRRRYIAQSYRVLLQVGDDLADFISEYRTPEQARLREAQKYSQWGTRWFMLPNPMYGSWESTLYDFNLDLSAAEVAQSKFKRLP
jgi:5'-nucleotidase (lipoprotein e(P4) family)